MKPVNLKELSDAFLDYTILPRNARFVKCYAKIQPQRHLTAPPGVRIYRFHAEFDAVSLPAHFCVPA